MILYLITADLLMGGIFLFKYSRLPPQIPLFYSKLWGEQQLADLWMISLLPIILHILIFTNTVLVRRYFKDDMLITRIMNYLNIVLIVTFTFIFIRIILLVT